MSHYPLQSTLALPPPLPHVHCPPSIIPVNEYSIKLQHLLVEFYLGPHADARQRELDRLGVLPNTTYQTVLKLVRGLRVRPNT